MYEEKLSIIIPTKNRQQYASKCIQTILSNPSDGFEVVVPDNSDNDSLRDMLSDLIGDKRLKYAYDAGVLSFCSNFERGVEMSSGDYLIIIGDDDCVFPEIVELADAVREKGIDSVVFSTESSYLWPNAVAESSGKLVIRKQFPTIKVKETRSAWKQMITVGNYDYQQYPFPKIYHGMIKREKFDLVKDKTGHYFGGLTPDIYSAVALSFYIDKILYISTPFTLPGTCAKSGSADSLTGRHTGELKDAPHFRGHDSYEWDPDIPYVYSVDTIWAETGFKAVKENGGSVSLSNEEYFAYLKHIVKRCSEFKDRMAEFYSDKTGCEVNKVKDRLHKEVYWLKKVAFIKKCRNFGIQLLKGRHVHNDVDDIAQAIKIACDEITDHQRVIQKVRSLNW